MVTTTLPRYDFVPLPFVAKSGKVEGNALAEIITGGIHQIISIKIKINIIQYKMFIKSLLSSPLRALRANRFSTLEF